MCAKARKILLRQRFPAETSKSSSSAASSIAKPSVMVVNQPTWGVDAGAAARIRQSLIDLARSGSAVLVISQDLDELFEMCDAIAVMHDGRLSRPLPRAEATFERIGLLMGGAEPGHAAQSHAAENA